MNKMLLAVGCWLLTLGAWAQAPIQTYEIRDFSGGMVTDFDLTDLPKNYGEWIKNFSCNEGRLEVRPGLEFTGSVDSQTQSYFRYTISAPKVDDTLSSFNGGSVTVQQTLGLEVVAGDSFEVQGFYMIPHYTPSTSIPGGGTWSYGWSGNFNSRTAAPGRAYWMQSSDIEWNVYNSVLRGMAGPYSLSVPAGYGDTSPWWFGYIGRYFWSSRRVGGAQLGMLSDDFYLYSGSLFPPDTTVIDSIREFGPTALYPHWGSLGIGNYWFAVAYEYDGFQYSVPTFSQSWFCNVTGDSTYIRMALGLDSLTTSRRITALIIFSSDSLKYDDIHYYDGGENNVGDGLPYFFRKRVVVSDPDSNKLGYFISNASTPGNQQYQWYHTSSTRKKILLFLENSSFAATQPEMWNYLGHESKENIVLPRYSAIIQDQSWAADVKIDALTSKVHERYRNMAIYSPIGQPDSYPINNFIIVGAGAGSYVTGIKEWNGKALIWTNDALEVWAPGDPPQRLEQFPHQGCTVPRSIQVTPEGVFYANNQEILLYTGSGTSQGITRNIESFYDSLRGFINDDSNGTWAASGLHTLPYAQAFYLPSLQQYILNYDSLYASRADTNSTVGQLNYVWGWIPPRRIYGGRFFLVYDVVKGSWSYMTFQNPFEQSIKTESGTLNLRAFAGNTYNYPGHYYYGTVPSAYWYSGWTDMGAPGVEKEINSVELDFELQYRDTLKLSISADGRMDTLRTLKFYQTDSLSGGWRKCQTRPITAGQMIVDPPNGHWGELFKYNLAWVKGDTIGHQTDTTAKVNAIRVNWTPKERRQP